MAVPYNVLNLSSVDEHIKNLETYLGYLEKATAGNLGDFTAAGKVVNAGYNNYTIYWDWYKTLGYGNMQQQPYCAGFVSTTLAIAFGLETAKKLLCGDLFIYCPTGWNQFNAKKRIYNKPQFGDVVFFWSASLGRWGHTGFVVGVDANGKGYTTIEANTSSGNDVVVRNGGATCRKHYVLGSGKVAFGRPDYAACGITLHPKTEDIVLTTYPIGTGANGLQILADSIYVRTDPGATTQNSIVTTLTNKDVLFPTKKAFVNGAPWFYDKKAGGWISAKYMTGWIQEFSDHDKWWWVEKDYKYPVDQIRAIDGNSYFFDSAGYMFTGRITFETDANGVLKRLEDGAQDE